MKRIFFIVSILLYTVIAKGQTQTNTEDKQYLNQVYLDKGERFGELTCFPSISKSQANDYYYLPNKIVLAKDGTGKDVFSLVKYKTENSGGGHVSMLIGLSVKEDFDAAKSAAQQKGKNLKGPLIYTGGTIELVCTYANKEKVIGIGPAPVMENDNIAIAFELTAENATILEEVLKAKNPGISVNLNMQLRGYQSPVGFHFSIDFKEVYKQKLNEVGVATPISSSQISDMVQDLKDKGAIKCDMVGNDEEMEKRMDIISNKLIDMCFTPLGNENAPNWAELAKPNREGKSLMDQATESLEKSNQETQEYNERIRREQQQYDQSRANNQQTPANTPAPQADMIFNEFGQVIGGNSVAPDEIEAPPSITDITNGNISRSTVPNSGNSPTPDNYKPPKEKNELPVKLLTYYQKKNISLSRFFEASYTQTFPTSIAEKFGNSMNVNCSKCFQNVDVTADPLFMKREILTSISGITAEDFKTYINSIEVNIRKPIGPQGKITDSKVINGATYNNESNLFKLKYGWDKVSNGKDWDTYEYKTTWVLANGATFDQDWTKTQQSNIKLIPPVDKSYITIFAENDEWTKQGITSATIVIKYTLKGKEFSLNATLSKVKGVLSATMPVYYESNTPLTYSYKITWSKKGNVQSDSGWKSNQIGEIDASEIFN